MGKTKIICTIGPASSSEEIIEQLILNGMNIARLNFSHGTHQEHLEKIKLIRAVSQRLNKPIAILQDICGPKIRVGELPQKSLELLPGEEIILSHIKPKSKLKHIPISYDNLYTQVEKGAPILLADGAMELLVSDIRQKQIFCTVVSGGTLTSKKGINFPSSFLKISSITEKDKKDIAFGLKNGVDFIALSFVKTKDDIETARKIIKKAKKDIPLIAKIEKHEAITNIDEIIEASNGIMIARGDLGVEIPLEEVPLIQKELIRKANQATKPVIVATQMLRSMEFAPMPTRAEATDVANAVWDGADAVMLSEETANGKYPVKAISYMFRILKATERNYPHKKYLALMKKQGLAENVAHSACELATDLNAKLIIAFTSSGYTASLIAKFRPKAKIIAISPNKQVLKTLAIFWGCNPYHLKFEKTFNALIASASKKLFAEKIAEKGDLVIVTAGSPLGKAGTTNMVKAINL